MTTTNRLSLFVIILTGVSFLAGCTGCAMRSQYTGQVVPVVMPQQQSSEQLQAFINANTARVQSVFAPRLQ
jgi:hypothetical protein